MGFDISAGEKILSSGDKLGPSELGLLATVGITEVQTDSSSTAIVVYLCDFRSKCMGNQ